MKVFEVHCEYCDAVLRMALDDSRLLTLATKHCPKDHHDWQEIQRIAGDVTCQESNLIERAIRNARPFAHAEPRWVMVKRVFGTGQTVSEAICIRYGFDPDEEVAPMR